MGRIYIRKPGSRTYGNFSEQQIEDALKDVVDIGLSLRKAAKRHNISYGTLNNKYHGKCIKKTGCQPVFSEKEEAVIISSVLKCSNWGYPLTSTDLRMFVKSHLDKCGRNISKFKNNLPGEEWARSLLRRNKNVAAKRLATNITTSRSSVTPDTLKKYFGHLEETVNGIPESNIFNYDESNVTDNPGKKLCIYRRGTKYPEKVCNHSKSSTSIMMCGLASGVLPYVIYKSENMWNTWTHNGPKGAPCCDKPCCSLGARYNRTVHGWIDMSTFNDWFSLTFLPHTRRLEGKKVLMGDNLASHFNPDVIRLCEENNISFVCIPPNSTSICQPLDVAFFRPFKEAWRKTLTAWKLCNRRKSGIPKDELPALLRDTLLHMDAVPPKKGDLGGSAIKRNLMAGFKACGIVPLNAQKVLDKLPGGESVVTVEGVNDSLVQFLSTQRYGSATAKSCRGRKRLRVEPGRSITHASAINECGTGSTSDSSANGSTALPSSEISSNESDGDNHECSLEYEKPTTDNVKGGQYILARFLGGNRKKTEFRYVCIVEEVMDDGNVGVIGMKSMEESKKSFKVVDNDVSVIKFKEILAVLPNPKIEMIGERIKYIFKASIDVKER